MPGVQVRVKFLPEEDQIPIALSFGGVEQTVIFSG